jgi:hypothetical protein
MMLMMGVRCSAGYVRKDEKKVGGCFFPSGCWLILLFLLLEFGKILWVIDDFLKNLQNINEESRIHETFFGWKHTG